MNATLTQTFDTTTLDPNTFARRWDPECPIRRQIQCPGCSGWHRLEYNANAKIYYPVSCHRCNIDLTPQLVPATVVTPEPAAPVVAVPQVTPESVIVAQNATEAEPGPAVEPVALRPVRPEQKAYFVKFVLNSDQSKKYAMLFRKSDGLAVGCECKSRKFHRGVACKHMKSHNAMLAPAKKQQQEAA